MSPATIDATDSAKAAAKEAGLDLAEVQGTGADGRITKADVDKALGSSSSSSSSWPSKGYSGSQPWEADEAPPVSHSKPQLVSGSAGPEVQELGQLLARLGYETDASEGRNPFSVVGPSEVAAIQAFRRDYGVKEDPSGYPDLDDDARRTIGPWTWEALYKAVDAL